MSSRWLAPLLLVVCVLIFFWPLVLSPGSVLYAPRSDMIAQHIPAKMFLVDSLAETGERPLWCPFRFCGDPFVADVQVAAFYPPHLLVTLLPREGIGAFLSWLMVLHVLTAGLCAYAYARHDGLSPVGSFVAGAGYMFAGKWLLHMLAAGHYVVIGLAWFPLALLCFEKAIRGRSLAWATGAGVAFSLVVLGTQPQWVLYAGLLAVAWTAGTALESADSFRAVADGLFAWARYGIWTLAIAVALAAAQLLPTREAAGLSSRARDTIVAFFRQDGIQSLRSLIGPSLVDVSWENVYGAGLIWVMSAVAAARWLPGRAKHYAWAAVCITIFAICNGGPGQSFPILRQFRGHFRAFMVAALPLALLAGLVTDRLATAVDPGPELRRRLALWMGGVGVVCLLGGLSHAVDVRPNLCAHPYWYTLPITVPCLIWLVWSSTPWRQGWGVYAWCGLLVADVFALGHPIVDVRTQTSLYRPSPCVEYIAERQHERGRVLDLYAPDQPYKSPLGDGCPLAMTQRLDAVRGYNPIDVARFRDYLQYIADRDQPAYPVEVLADIPEANRNLIDLLGVRFRLHPDGAPAPGPGWKAVFRDDAPIPAYHHGDGGFPTLPPYTVYENDNAFPRAFVVPDAVPIPPGEELLETLKCVDFRQTVLLDHYKLGPAKEPGTAFRPARIVSYRPNRVTIEAEADASGWLVLTDNWHPGWSTTVDGQDAPMFRANYTFRAVELPAGRHEVVFAFNPKSYRLGRAISLITAGSLSVAALLMGWQRIRKSTAPREQPVTALARDAA